MNTVLYYSDTGESKRVASFLAARTKYALLDMSKTELYQFENAVLVFPVRCQGIPNAVRQFLRSLQAENLTFVATYGRMSCGNVLCEIQRKYSFRIVSAAYYPTKHAYLNEESASNLDVLLPLVDKIIRHDTPVTLPRLRKNPFAAFFPKLRSQIGCKIVKNPQLCNNCAICDENCVEHAIHCGKTNGKCVRCLRCVQNCPNGALTFRLSPAMKAYLNKKKRNKPIIYV